MFCLFRLALTISESTKQVKATKTTFAGHQEVSFPFLTKSHLNPLHPFCLRFWLVNTSRSRVKATKPVDWTRPPALLSHHKCQITVSHGSPVKGSSSFTIGQFQNWICPAAAVLLFAGSHSQTFRLTLFQSFTLSGTDTIYSHASLICLE